MKTEQEAKKQVERILTQLVKRVPFDVTRWKTIVIRLLNHVDKTYC